MPTHVQTVPLTERITEHMRTKPRGRFRPSEIADALPPIRSAKDPMDGKMATAKWRQKVSNEMARMARSGTLLRGRVTEKAMGPGVYYWLPTGKAAPKPPHKAASVTVVCSCGRTLPSLQAFKDHQGKYKP